MPDKSACFLIAGAWAAAVFAQPTTGTLDQVIHLTRADTDQQLQEIATDLRGITEIQASVDTKQKILILHGTAGQITAAEWLANQLENPVQQPHEYRLASDDIVRAFFFAHAETPRRLQEAATNIRSIADIRRLFTYNGANAITVRGTALQIALSTWLVSELDQPSNQHPASSVSHEYRMSSAVDDVVRFFYPAHISTPWALQEMATDVRSIAAIRRLFTYSAPVSLLVRGTASEIELAEWLVNELDQPSNQPPRTPAAHEYRPLRTVDDIVRVFFLTDAETPQRLQEVAVTVRKTTEIKRIFTYNPTHALALRGTAAQIALADRLIAEQDRQ